MTILGTGVGGGIVAHGKILVGANAIAGEWGHNRLPGDELDWPECYCGRKGCVQTFLSGSGMKHDHAKTNGEILNPDEIAARAVAGRAACETMLRRYEQRLARALAQVVNILDPDAVVLGGGLSNLERLHENVPRIWGAYVFSDQVATRFLMNRHGDASGLLGAAWLW